MIKVKVREVVGKKNEYPKLMKFTVNNTIVLFTGSETGVVIRSCDDELKKGDYSDGWRMDKFEDFHGTITLQNDL